jgi:hypothetical protein
MQRLGRRHDKHSDKQERRNQDAANELPTVGIGPTRPHKFNFTTFAGGDTGDGLSV